MLEVNRREFLKSSVAASAAATVGIPLTAVSVVFAEQVVASWSPPKKAES